MAAACAQAVEAEIENDSFYDRVSGAVEGAGARDVMRRLQGASRENYPAAYTLVDHDLSDAILVQFWSNLRLKQPNDIPFRIKAVKWKSLIHQRDTGGCARRPSSRFALSRR